MALSLALLALAAVRAPLSSSAPVTSPGQLYAFGYNYYGQLGNPANVKVVDEPNPVPAIVALPGQSGQIAQVAAGARHSLALTSSDQLYAFGGNEYGQLGVTANAGSIEPNPTAKLVTLPGMTGQIAQIAAGTFHSLVLTSTGQLYAFGRNLYGPLGNATNDTGGAGETPNPVPAPVGLPGATGQIVQIAAGGYHSLALTSSGQVFAFGLNQNGQLGNATHAGTTEPNPKPALVTFPGISGQVTQIAAGDRHSLALTSSGQLYAFGDNGFGQLGIPANAGNETANPVPTLVTLPVASGQVVQIAAGGEHSLALTSSGRLYAFGENLYGELGVSATAGNGNANATPQLVTLPGTSGQIVQLAAGLYQSYVLTATGQLLAFGSNFSGQLGSAINAGAIEPNPTPTPVALPAGATVDTVARGPDGVQGLVVLADLSLQGSPLPGGLLGAPYSAQPQALGGTLPYTWSATGLAPGLSIDTASGAISGVPTSAGSYTVTVTVTDSYGIQASAAMGLVVSAPGPATQKARVSQAPLISAVRQSASVWREGARLARTSAAAFTAKHRLPLGTTFSFALNEQATITFTFTRSISGRRAGRRCVAQTHANARGKRCTRTVTAGVLTFTGHSSTNKVAFQGRLSASRRLAPGRYTLTITAANSAGKAVGPAPLSFTIAR